MANNQTVGLNCPIPISDYPQVLLAHGGGGRLMHRLISRMFEPSFAGATTHDGAALNIEGTRLAFTTDSFVVQPLFFPGGDIGQLAVHGTVNDLAMCGARPRYLSLGFIIEEGLPMEMLWRIVQSIQRAAEAIDVQVVTGDTKVVDMGKGDGIFINTSGIGVIEHQLHIQPAAVREGDVIILSGDIGRHGIAIMAEREGLSFESAIESDSAPLVDPVMALLEAGIDVHCLRDLTRGGLSSGLIEIAKSGQVHVHLQERSIPVREDVRAACEILGLDPMYVANEGRFVAFVPPEEVERTIDILHKHPVSHNAVQIGTVTTGRPGVVSMTTPIGANHIVDMLSGEQLPRIC